MADRSSPTIEENCPGCRSAGVAPQLVDEVFDFQSDQGVVSVAAHGVPVYSCPACGESWSGPEAARVRHRAICDALGLLHPEAIRSIRDRLGLSQVEFAQLTGFGEATISRWERGRLLQNRANDRYLRLLDSDPKNLAFLSSLAS